MLTITLGLGSLLNLVSILSWRVEWANMVREGMNRAERPTQASGSWVAGSSLSVASLGHIFTTRRI